MRDTLCWLPVRQRIHYTISTSCKIGWSPTLERHADQRWIRQKARAVTPPMPTDRASTSQERTSIIDYLLINPVVGASAYTGLYQKNSPSLVKYPGALLTGLRVADGSVFCICLSVYPSVTLSVCVLSTLGHVPEESRNPVGP